MHCTRPCKCAYGDVFLFYTLLLYFKIICYFFVIAGHSAKYGSYTMMDLQTNNIVDIQLVQVFENMWTSAADYGEHTLVMHNYLKISTLLIECHVGS